MISTDTATTEGHEALALLERTRSLVDPQLRAAVESLPGSIRRVAMYHFGWEHADGTATVGQAGEGDQARARPRRGQGGGRRRGAGGAGSRGRGTGPQLQPPARRCHRRGPDPKAPPHGLDGVRRPGRRHRGRRHARPGPPAARRGHPPGVGTCLGPARELRHRAVRGTAGRLLLRGAWPRRGLARRVSRHGHRQDRRPPRLRLRTRCAVQPTWRSGRSARWTASAGRRASPSSSSTI